MKSQGLRRWLPALPGSTNPLIRPTDRISAAIRLVALTACVLALPCAVAVGANCYATTADRIRVANDTKAQVTATVVADPRAAATRGSRVAQLRWKHAGTPSLATAPVARTSTRGDLVRLWLDADGTPTTPPVRPARAIPVGIRAGLAALLSTYLAALLLVKCTDLWMARLQSSRWDEDWRRWEHKHGQPGPD